MKLSSRSRYGTRLVLDLAQHFDKGPIPIGDIARRQEVSVKYLEQLIIPLKKAYYVKSVRGAKGGHMLTKPPEEITVGEIVKLLEGGLDLAPCIDKPEKCNRYDACLARVIWEEATNAIYDKLNSVTLSSMIKQDNYA